MTPGIRSWLASWLPVTPTLALTLILELAPATGIAARAADAAPAGAQLLSAYQRVEYCDLAMAPNGALHAVFTERPALDRAALLYYRTSQDDGRTWSPSIILNNADSGDDASVPKVFVDGSGRVYAVWKSVRRGSLLDGPGGTAVGRLAYRVQVGGTWSAETLLHDAKAPAFSWFGSVAPNGALHVVWSQVTEDTPTAYFFPACANLIRQAVLDGASIQSVRALTTPSPILTDAQVKALRAANRPVPYAEMQPKQRGFLNLSGYVDAQGEAHFIAEDPGVTAPNGSQGGRRVVWRDGAEFVPIYEYERYKTYNNFNNPPGLALDAEGKPHVLRAPEKGGTVGVGDFRIEGGKLELRTMPIRPKSGPGLLANWQWHRLAGGCLALTAALSERGGYDPADLDLYISFFDGKETWTPALKLTDALAAQHGFHRETTGANTIGALTQHKPRFASVVLGRDGRPRLLWVDNEDTLVGVSGPATTTSGRLVTASGTLRTDAPSVYFSKLDAPAF